MNSYDTTRPLFAPRGVSQSKKIRLAEAALMINHTDAPALLKKALDNPNLNLKTKNWLAGINLSLTISQEWGLEHFDIEQLPSVIDNVRSFHARPMNFALKNPNLNPLCIEKIIRKIWGEPNYVFACRAALARGLSEVTLKNHVAELLSSHASLGLDLAILAGHARRIHNIDASIPDEWVKKMFS